MDFAVLLRAVVFFAAGFFALVVLDAVDLVVLDLVPVLLPVTLARSLGEDAATAAAPASTAAPTAAAVTPGFALAFDAADFAVFDADLAVDFAVSETDFAADLADLPALSAALRTRDLGVSSLLGSAFA